MALHLSLQKKYLENVQNILFGNFLMAFEKEENGKFNGKIMISHLCGCEHLTKKQGTKSCLQELKGSSGIQGTGKKDGNGQTTCRRNKEFEAALPVSQYLRKCPFLPLATEIHHFPVPRKLRKAPKESSDQSPHLHSSASFS